MKGIKFGTKNIYLKNFNDIKFSSKSEDQYFSKFPYLN